MVGFSHFRGVVIPASDDPPPDAIDTRSERLGKDGVASPLVRADGVPQAGH